MGPPQIVDLPLAVGLDTKSDPKVAQGLLAVRNAEVRQTGLIEKRRAFVPLSRDVNNGGFNAAVSGQTGFREEPSRFIEAYGLYANKSQLLLHGRDVLSGNPLKDANTGDLFAAYDSNVDRWVPKYIHTPVSFSLSRSGETVNAIDSIVASGGGYRVFISTYTDITATQVQLLTVVNEATGEIIWRATSASQKYAHGAFLFKAGIRKYVAYANDASANLYRYTWNPTTPETPPVVTANAFTDGHATDCLFDAAPNSQSTALLLAYKRATSNDIIVRKVDADGTELETALVVADTPKNALTIFPVIAAGVEQYIVVCQDNAAGACRVIVLSTALALIADTVPVAGYTTNNWSRVTGTQLNIVSGGAALDGAFVVGVTDENATITDRFSRFNTFVFAGTLLGGASKRIDHSILFGKMFTLNGRAYAPSLSYTLFQQTYFLYSLSTIEALDAGVSDDLDYPAICAKALNARVNATATGGILNLSHLTDVQALGAGKFLMAGVRAERIDAENLGFATVTGASVALEFILGDAAPAAIEFGKGTILPGGTIAALDGGFQELGFHIYPENIIHTDDGIGVLSAGLYSWTGYLEWVDRHGQLHRSALATPVTYTHGALSKSTITIELNLPASPVKYGSPWVTFRLYRTEANGSVYYEVATYRMNWVTAASPPAIGDNIADTALIALEPLYTAGGVLEAYGAPAGSIMAADHNRLYLVPYDDPWAIWYTKPKEEAIAPEFVDGQFVRIESDGPNTGLVVIDGQKIIFKPRAIYAFSGDGPNALGQGEFTPPRKLASEVGCVDYRSIVLCSEGAIFRSEAGYYLLNRALQTLPIGLPVAKYAALPVAAALVVPALEQIWFVLKDQKTALVFDYIHKIWGTHELEKTAAGAAYANGVLYFAAKDGTVFRRDAAQAANVAFFMSTPWYKAQTLQGKQRVWWLHLLGNLAAAFKVTIFYDYEDGEDAYSQTIKFSAKAKRKMVRIKPAKKKCTTFRLDIEQTGKLSLDMGLNALSLAYAPIARLARLASAETK